MKSLRKSFLFLLRRNDNKLPRLFHSVHYVFDDMLGFLLVFEHDQEMLFKLVEVLVLHIGVLMRLVHVSFGRRNSKIGSSLIFYLP